MTDSPLLSRRDFGKLALAAIPALSFAQINSRIKNIQFGAITYSFNRLPSADDIIKAYVSIGLGEMELMSNHCEALAGAPRAAGGGGRGRGQLTPEEQAARDLAAQKLREWRMAATEATFKPVRQKITDAGIDLRLLVYNMNSSVKDEDIEYAFTMARGLGAKAISTSTQVSMAKRIAPFAEKHKMMVGVHGHNDVARPDEVSTKETFEAVFAAGKYMGANLDIGHFTAADGDSVAFLKQHHARVTNLHVKDMKKGGGSNYTPFGQGDSPIKEVLQLLSKEKWDIPANIEFEYGGDALVEVPKCFQYCKDALA